MWVRFVIKTTKKQLITVIMFLNIETYFDHPGYSPGDTITCLINVNSMFKLNCKYVRARFRCPFQKNKIEYFRVYEIANKRIAKSDKDLWKYRIGEKGLSFTLISFVFERMSGMIDPVLLVLWKTKDESLMIVEKLLALHLILICE